MFAVEFFCVGVHGSSLRPMNVFIQAIGKNSGRRLKSAPFILKGRRKKELDLDFRYFQEKANENPPTPAPTPTPAPATTATTVPAPAPVPVPPILTPILLAQDPTTVHYNQDQGNRANPPPPTQNHELSARPESPGDQTCFEDFSSVENSFSFLGQVPGNVWDNFRSGRIDN